MTEHEETIAALTAMGVTVPPDWSGEQAAALYAELLEAEKAEPVDDGNPFPGIAGGASPRG